MATTHFTSKHVSRANRTSRQFRSKPRIWLRAEGLGLVMLSVSAYALLGGGWGWFAGLFLVPDIAIAGYLLGTRVGATCYNVAHTSVGPLGLAAIGLMLDVEPLLLAAALWCAHIGFDRALGFGLKYDTRFSDTHLDRV